VEVLVNECVLIKIIGEWIMPDGSDGIQRVPVRVLGCLRSGFLTVDVWPGGGLADGGIRQEIPIGLVPFELRLPNSRFNLLFDPTVNDYVGSEP
jgi:hypothetical protein